MAEPSKAPGVGDCVNLVMNTLARMRGDHAIIRSGHIPIMTRDACRYPLARRAVARESVVEIVRYLLPVEWQRAVDEIGETRYRLPRELLAHDDFIVNVIDSDTEVCVDIERRDLYALPGP